VTNECRRPIARTPRLAAADGPEQPTLYVRSSWVRAALPREGLRHLGVAPGGKHLLGECRFLHVPGASQHPAYASWSTAGRPLPLPHLAKEPVVREHVARLRVPVFVETGTFLGEMVDAIRDSCEEVLLDRDALGAVL